MERRSEDAPGAAAHRPAHRDPHWRNCVHCDARPGLDAMSYASLSKAILERRIGVRRFWRIADGRRKYGYRLQLLPDPILQSFALAYARGDSNRFATDDLFPKMK